MIQTAIRGCCRNADTAEVKPAEVMPTSPRPSAAGHADPSPTSWTPSVLVFDVNETLIDIEAMTPLFTQIFGDCSAMREWFGQLGTYSMTTAISHRYVDYFTLGQALTRVLADIQGPHVSDDDLHRVKDGMLTMPAHRRRRGAHQAARQRLSARHPEELTAKPGWPKPLEHAGLTGLF
jgi:2-haloacid dehalogenase